MLTDGGQRKLYPRRSCVVSAFGDRISIQRPDSGILQMLGIALYRAVTAAASLGTDISQHLTDAHPALLSGIGWGREESCMSLCCQDLACAQSEEAHRQASAIRKKAAVNRQLL